MILDRKYHLERTALPRSSLYLAIIYNVVLGSREGLWRCYTCRSLCFVLAILECLEKFLSGSYIAVSLNFHLLKFDDYCYVFLSNITEWKIGYVIATVIISTS